MSRIRCGTGPISVRITTDLEPEFDRSRGGMRPISARSSTDLGERGGRLGRLIAAVACGGPVPTMKSCARRPRGRRGGPSAIGQWLRAALPRRLPGLVWAVLAPSVVTSLVRAYAPAPFQDGARLVGTVLVLGVVLGGLADDRAHALLAAHDLAGGVVGALEAEPPALIRRHVEGAVVRQPFGQAHPLPFCQTFEGGHAHRPREMQMEVCLGEQVEIAHGSIFPHAASGRRDAKVSG